MKKSTMNATKLRVILTVVIFLLLSLSAVGFYFGQSWLRTLATSVGQTVAQSRESNNKIQSFKALQQDLLDLKTTADKAGMLTIPSENYQTQTIQDLNNHAARAGITIVNYDFAQAATANVAGAVTAAPAAVKTGSSVVTVSLVSPITYVNLLKFMAAIETNLPKMQVLSVNLGRGTDGGDSVNTDKLIIEVYTH